MKIQTENKTPKESGYQLPTWEELEQMAQTDIRNVDPSELVDIKNVKIRTDLPPRERLADYISQIRNPYCYLDHGTIVKLKFAGERSLEDCLSTCISMEA